jgi:hypothetical protein
MSGYYPITPAYMAARYGGRYTPAPMLMVPETPPAARNGDDLTDLIGIDPAWIPRRDKAVVPAADLATMMLQEKADLGKMTVGSLVYQIIQRERIKDANLTHIGYQEAAIGGRLLRLERAWMPGQLPLDNKMKMGLEAELLRLDQLKLAEEIECWRDISRLKEKLLESLALYRDSARRERMVASGLPLSVPVPERG